MKRAPGKKLMVLVIVTPFLFINSRSTSRLTINDLKGTYTQIAKQGYKFGYDLTLTEKRFAFIDHHDYNKNEYNPYICCDTIAYGNWTLDNKHNTLAFSTPDYGYTVLSSDIKEEIDSTKKDSLFFLISNPIEERMYKNHEDIEYQISMFADDALSHVSDINPRGLNLGEIVSDQIFNTNRIAIPNPDKARVRSFWVIIFVKPTYRGKGRDIGVISMFTDDYLVLDMHSNVFKINIPKLNYGFITYLRYDNDLVKIVDKNTLEWHGLKYIRINK